MLSIAVFLVEAAYTFIFPFMFRHFSIIYYSMDFVNDLYGVVSKLVCESSLKPFPRLLVEDYYLEDWFSEFFLYE